MEQSILKTVKKNVGIDPSNTEFDLDIITAINTVCATLAQLGVGPANGFMIEDDEPVWDDLIGDDKELNLVKNYMILRVRMLFDPPTTSYLINALKDEVEELGWRINTHREETEWVDPTPEIEDETILLGGGA